MVFFLVWYCLSLCCTHSRSHAKLAFDAAALLFDLPFLLARLSQPFSLFAHSSFGQLQLLPSQYLSGHCLQHTGLSTKGHHLHHYLHHSIRSRMHLLLRRLLQPPFRLQEGVIGKVCGHCFGHSCSASGRFERWD